jgi:hypothetical protein
MQAPQQKIEAANAWEKSPTFPKGLLLTENNASHIAACIESRFAGNFTIENLNPAVAYLGSIFRGGKLEFDGLLTFGVTGVNVFTSKDSRNPVFMVLESRSRTQRLLRLLEQREKQRSRLRKRKSNAREL